MDAAFVLTLIAVILFVIESIPPAVMPKPGYSLVAPGLAFLAAAMCFYFNELADIL